ncbi:hypothetical protein FXB40_23160 [Bradyrhizobium rifense]|uniref:Uncharacterized protein n=1 Tax=Bradyrhizobium rifense TaxID=515499 RepID=A0A5D3KAV7_9BRAD|nr:hypothetical protein FXB40_23160 [Bradyrhizobium rifense]
MLGAGNRASYCPEEGSVVRSVASLEVAAGLPGLRGPEDDVRCVVRPRGMDRSRGTKRLSFDRWDLRHLAMPSETAVSTQKHIEIIFEGTDSSCYPWLSLGAKGIVSSTSRSPN